MEYIPIDPIENCLIAIEIVHGKAYADYLRMIISMKQRQAEREQQEMRIKRFCEEM